MKSFSIIGAAGYIAPRHLKAIYETGNNVIAAYDPNDSVGILDRYSKEVNFFKSFEEFYYFLKKQHQGGTDYTTICTPNYLHKSHIQLSLDLGASTICEKPLCLSVQELEQLRESESRSGKKVYTILQLREHNIVQSLHHRINSNGSSSQKHEIELCYITSRGPWYHTTWKADPKKSGGLAFNIGIHFFDMLNWIFGKTEKVEMHVNQIDTMSGYLETEKARIKWFLSINEKYLPEEAIGQNKATYRSLLIDGQEFEFSQGFTDLHTKVYQSILEGRGYGLEDIYEATKTVETLTSQKEMGVLSHSHPHLSKF